jgi:hypothetical protein
MTLLRSESMRQVHALVHDYTKGLLRAVKQFESADPDHYLLHQVYLAEWPVKKFLDLAVKVFLSSADAPHQFFKMFDVYTLHILHGQKLRDDFLAFLARDLPLVNGLQSPPTGPAA